MKALDIQASRQGTPPRVLDDHSRLRLQKAAKDFEAVFLGYVLKSMRNAQPVEDEMFGSGYGGDLMEGLFDMELARHVSRTGSLGLAEMLYKRITGDDLPRGHVPPAQVAPATPPAVPPSVVSAADPPAAQEAVTSPPAGSAAVAPATVAVPDTLQRRLAAFEPHIREASEKHGIDANLLKAVIAAESSARADALSRKDAKGLMQLLDSTATSMGVKDVWNPKDNINGGARYLQGLMERFRGDVGRALASYNAGPGAVAKYGGIPPFRETREYVDKVLSYFRFFEQQGQDNGTGDR